MNELVASHISKTYKKRKVVDDVSFHVKSGEIVGLLGPNGAGKTTSFYMVVGLVQPDQGLVKLNEKDLTLDPIFKRARQGLSYLAQEPSIFRKLTVSENIEVALEAHDIGGGDRAKKLEELLQDFRLTHVKKSSGFMLSGGERRRAEIARALAGAPSFLLLDEPFAGIDPIAVHDIQQIILGLKNRGLGILITDHNVRETLGICDRAYILKDGRIQVEGTSNEIANSDLAKKFYLGENFKL